MGLFKKIFKIKPKRFLGIDIGTTSLRVAEIRRRGKRLHLQNYGEAFFSLPEKDLMEIRKGEGEFFEKSVAEAIKKIRKKAKISTKDANIAIPDFLSFYASFTLPPMGKEEISHAIQYEVRPHIPLPLSEITLDFVITEGKTSKTPLKILVIAVPNDIIKSYRNIAELSGLKLKSLEPEVPALARALIREEDEKKAVGLIDFGEKSTTCSVIDKGVLKISHSFRVGGAELTEALAGSLNIGLDAAEKMKRREGISEEGKAKEPLFFVAERFAAEIEKVLRDYRRQEEKDIEKMFIFGRSALMPGLREYFEKRLSKKIVLADSFANLIYPDSLEKLSPERKMVLGIPIGIAMKELKSYNKKVK